MRHPVASIERRTLLPNVWDLLVVVLAVGVCVALADGAREAIHESLLQLEQTALSLDPWVLPYYALRTTLRMFLALGASLLFTLLFAALAAKSRARSGCWCRCSTSCSPSRSSASCRSPSPASWRCSRAACSASSARRSSRSSPGRPGTWPSASTSRCAPCRASCARQSRSFQLSGWQRFWRLELPFAMPGLVWNMMMSMSGGWFFVVASEAISVGDQSIKLPGVGSYIALAIEARDLGAIGWAIGGMLVGIVLYDQLLFRPLVAWADKFRFEDGGEERRAVLAPDLAAPHRLVARPVAALLERRCCLGCATCGTSSRPARPPDARRRPVADAALATAVLVVGSAWRLSSHCTYRGRRARRGGHVLVLGLITLARVLVLIALAALVWVPFGIWVGMSPRWAGRLQGVAQFLAAFPANLMFPVAVVFIVRWHLNPNIWLSPLMVLGTQWYLLFNVIAGARAADRTALRGQQPGPSRLAVVAPCCRPCSRAS